VEANLFAELAAMTPDDLGQIDTFREEENRVLEGAVAALRAGEWSKARAWSDARQGEKSFWLARDPSRRFTWSLVEEAARFGEILAKHPKPLAGARSLEDVAWRYTEGTYEVDRAHRRFEQKRLMLLEPRLPHFGLLQEIVGALRKEHRAWADALTQDFTAVCVEHGFLPPDTFQQRTLFEQVVHPLASSGEKVAFFIIDAFRYEMATELVEEMGGASGPAGVVDLKARFAELPTITSVGMNVLAPVAQSGRLAIAGTLEGFKTGEFTVRKPEDRARAMGVRSTGKPALLLTLSEVCDQSTATLTKQVRQNGFVVVHSREIDDAGEANVGIPTFESSLRQIKSAWRHLQLAGVKNFVFTADHGFLIQDETTKLQPYGTRRSPKRRHVLDRHPRAETGMVPVSLSSLNYDGLGGYLLFREDTAVFDTGNAGATFVHGGNSLQERLIPVLIVTRKRVEAGGLTDYVVEAEPLSGVFGLHRLRLRVVLKRTTLDYATIRSVDVAIRGMDRPDVQAIVKEAAGAGTLRAGRVEVPIGEAWTEVFFSLQGPQDERMRVEVHHPDGVERVTPAQVDAWFSVSGFSIPATPVPAAKATPPSMPPASLLNWADAFAEEGIRRVFLHIEKHGLIDEAEVTAMLGSPREFRKFSRDFDAHLAKLPFRVKIDTADGGKRYVREGEK
jgi:PglZ domain